MSAPKAEAGLSVERREELRRLAEAATPGPWEVPVSIHGDPFVVQKGKGVLTGGCIARASGEDYGKANSEHIAAFDPPTVLALLDALAAAEAERGAFADEVLRWQEIAGRDAEELDEARASVERAWDEGRRHGAADRQGYEVGDGCGPDPWDCTCPNPYRTLDPTTRSDA